MAQSEPGAGASSGSSLAGLTPEQILGFMQRGTGSSEVGNRTFSAIHDSLAKKAYSEYLRGRNVTGERAAGTSQFDAETRRMVAQTGQEQLDINKYISRTDRKNADSLGLYRSGQLSALGAERSLRRDLTEQRITNETYGLDLQRARDLVQESYISGQLSTANYLATVKEREREDLKDFRNKDISIRQYSNRLQANRDAVQESLAAGKLSNDEYTLELQRWRDLDTREYQEGLIKEKEFANRITAAANSVDASYKAGLLTAQERADKIATDRLALAGLIEKRQKDLRTSQISKNAVAESKIREELTWLKAKKDVFDRAIEIGASVEDLNAPAASILGITPSSAKEELKPKELLDAVALVEDDVDKSRLWNEKNQSGSTTAWAYSSKEVVPGPMNDIPEVSERFELPPYKGRQLNMGQIRTIAKDEKKTVDAVVLEIYLELERLAKEELGE